MICAPVYVELAAHPAASRTFIDKLLEETGIALEFRLEEPVWRKAAEAFAAYAQRRRRPGTSTAKRWFADFLIAAHALLKADRLRTLEPERYRQDFPKLRLL